MSITQSTTNSGGGNSILSTTGSVSVQSPYSGSAAQQSTGDGTLSLTLADALARGLKFNLGALTQASSVKQAQGEREVAKSALLPTVNTEVSEEFERINLRTTGVESSTFPTASKFNFYDARAARLEQSVFDLVRTDNLHSATENLKATMNGARDSRDLVVLAVGGAYLQLIATQARVSAAQAQVETSRAIDQQAADRLAAGLAARIDVTRSQVQLQTEQQRLRSLRADLDTQKLRLARIIGLSLGQHFEIADSYRYSPVVDLTESAALQLAMERRNDLQAATSAVKAAEQSVKAAHAERLPNLIVSADFGAAGRTPTRHSTGVYSVYGTLTIPLYEGGRIHGDIDQAAAALQQRKSEFEDLRGQVDQDVRQSFIDLNAAAGQVDVAKSNVELSHDTLTQSRDRFAAGIADTVEVVQAEQAVVQADDDYITAVYQHNLAKVSLARAVGNAEQMLPSLMRK